MAYRPLLMGVLAGKYTPAGPIPEDSRGSGDKRIPDWLERFGPGLEQFAEFAAARDMHSAQLAVTWVRKSLGEQFPIVGVSSERQLQASLDAFATDLTDDEHETVTSMFDTAVKEESGGNFANLRRSTNLIA